MADNTLIVQSKKNSPYYAAGSEVMEFFEDIAPNEYGCEFRQGQYDMAVDIIEALRCGKHYISEAGVGIGKSYAYLTPLLLLSRKLDAPVAVATSTIALQEQLASDMKKLSAMLGVRCNPVIAKGQTHYICLNKAARYLTKHGEPLDIEEDGTMRYGATMDTVKRIAGKLNADESENQTECGGTGIGEEQRREILLSAIKAGIEAGCADRKEFPFEIPDKIWSQVNITAFNPGNCKQRCPFISTCPYNKMRKELLNSKFIICNQDLLTRHFLNMDKYVYSPILNPCLRAIVVDEAHNLENKVRSAVTVQFSEKKIEDIMDRAVKAAATHMVFALDRQTEKARAAMHDLFINLEIQRNRQIAAGKATGMQPGYADRYFFRDENGAFSLLRNMSDAFMDLSDDLTPSYSFNNSANKNSMALDAFDVLAAQMNSLCKGMDKNVIWICQGAGGIELDFCPKNIATISNRLFFSGAQRMILTSATLTGISSEELSAQYAYLKRSLGFTDESSLPLTEPNTEQNIIPTMLGEPKLSPYDYDSHAMVYYAGDMPHPSKHHQKFVERGTQRLMEILDISKGRALVLFTSKADMDEVAAELKRRHTPYHVLVQRAGASQADVLQKFREDVNSVLLGTGAFWEGVSIEGESLSNVVIFRLPFPVPDPIIDYKCSVAKDKLMDVLVPEMIIKLKQGVGRLIRNATDKGIISIIDGRMGERSDAKYKQAVWDALPIKNRTSSLKKIRRFYETVVLGSSEDAENAGNTENAGNAAASSVPTSSDREV